MSNVIQFPKKKKVDKEVIKSNTPDSVAERHKQIEATVERINRLMDELKRMSERDRNGTKS